MPIKKILTQTWMCSKHRSYQAEYAPHIECYDCWEIFFRENPRLSRMVKEIMSEDPDDSNIIPFMNQIDNLSKSYEARACG